MDAPVAGPDPFALVNKWLHLLSIIGVVGGTAFALFVLSALRDDVADSAKLAWKRFGMALGGLWLIVLGTGFINFYLVSPKVTGMYHMWLGMKIMLALFMFFLSVAIAHPFPLTAKLTQNRTPWLAAILVMGVLAVGISAHLNISRVNGTGLKPKPAATNLPAPAEPSQAAPANAPR